MRVSAAALALITRLGPQGEVEYLAQWSDSWQAYSLIGGHQEQGESFRECCLREIQEEANCSPQDVVVSPYPHVTLQFREYSQAAREETNYQWQVFVAQINEAVLQQLPSTCTFISVNQIRTGRTTAGKPIADQVRKVLAAVERAEFDLFVAEGHADNQNGAAAALVANILSPIRNRDKEV